MIAELYTLLEHFNYIKFINEWNEIREKRLPPVQKILHYIDAK